MNSRAICLLPLLLGLCGLSAEAAPCHTEKATYKPVTNDNGARLHFTAAKQPDAWSNLNLVLTSKRTGKTYRFRFTASNGYSSNYLIPMPDEAAKPADDKKSDDEIASRDITAFFFAANMKSLAIPGASTAAPKYILLPRLGAALWYGSMNDKDIPNREFIPNEMWVLSNCQTKAK